MSLGPSPRGPNAKGPFVLMIVGGVVGLVSGGLLISGDLLVQGIIVGILSLVAMVAGYYIYRSHKGRSKD